MAEWMVQLSGSLADAMAIVRGQAYRHQRSLGAVAHEVVTGRLRLSAR